MKVQILFLFLGLYASNVIAAPNCEILPYNQAASTTAKSYFKTSKSEQSLAYSPSTKKTIDVSDMTNVSDLKVLPADSIIFSFQSSEMGPIIEVTKVEMKNLLKGKEDDVKIWLDPTFYGLISFPSLDISIYCKGAI